MLLLLALDPNAADAALPFIGLLLKPPPLPPKMELEPPVPGVLLAPEKALVDPALGPADAPKALVLVLAVKPPPPNVAPAGFGGFMFAPCAQVVPCSPVAGAPSKLKPPDGAPFGRPPKLGGAEAEVVGAPPPPLNGPLNRVDAKAAVEDEKAPVEGKALLLNAPVPPPVVLPVLLLPNDVLPLLPPLSAVLIPKAEAVALPEEPDAVAVDDTEETPAALANGAGDTFGPWVWDVPKEKGPAGAACAPVDGVADAGKETPPNPLLLLPPLLLPPLPGARAPGLPMSKDEEVVVVGADAAEVHPFAGGGAC